MSRAAVPVWLRFFDGCGGMSEQGRPDDRATEDREPAWRRRQRLAQIFGDVLPETTGDERDPADQGGGSGESASDTWLRSQVPPHHGQ